MRKILIPLSVIVVIVAVIFWFYHTRSVPVETALVVKGTINRIIPEDGTVKTKEEININAEVSGRIENLLVDEGAAVKKGDVIIEIEKTQLTAQVKQAESSLAASDELLLELKTVYDKAESDLKRTQSLASEGSISKERLEAAEVAFKSAQKKYQAAQLTGDGLKAALSAAQDRLSKATISAPVDGIVTIVHRKQGEVVAPGTPLVRIINPKSAYIEIEISESDIGEIAVGQNVRITADAAPGKECAGTLSQILAEAQRKMELIDASRTGEERIFRGIVKVPELPQWLRPGMSLYADIIAEQKSDMIIIPRKAVLREAVNPFQKEADKFYVYVIEDNHAVKRDVRVGIKEPEKVEITNGLNAGEKVAVAGLENLKDGKRVNVK